MSSLTDGNADVIIGTKYGYSVRFNEAVVRNMGRSATGCTWCESP